MTKTTKKILLVVLILISPLLYFIVFYILFSILLLIDIGINTLSNQLQCARANSLYSDCDSWNDLYPELEKNNFYVKKTTPQELFAKRQLYKDKEVWYCSWKGFCLMLTAMDLQNPVYYITNCYIVVEPDTGKLLDFIPEPER